jgi:TonB-dependent SusC/RagA subfamily outer membrane receptor
MWRTSGIAAAILLSACIGLGCGSSQSVTSDDSVPAAPSVDAGGVTQSEDLIRDRIPGVHVRRTAEGYEIRIRDGARLNDNGEPLYVVNGSPVGRNALESLSPQDIASIQILKGAKAARYGARAGNGVVVVTTK